MRSTTVSIPRYRHHKGSGQAFVQIKGKRHYIGKWDSPASKEAYSRFVAELAAAPAAIERLPLTTPAAPQLTVVELAAAYVDFAEGYYVKNGQPSNWLYHIRLMLGKLRDLYGRTPAADFGPLALKAIRQTMIDAGHSRPYINKTMAIVPRVFKWAAAEQLVPASVYHALRTVEGLRKGRTPARETPPVKPVADAVVDMTLPYCPQIVADMIRFQRFAAWGHSPRSI